MRLRTSLIDYGMNCVQVIADESSEAELAATSGSELICNSLV